MLRYRTTLACLALGTVTFAAVRPIFFQEMPKPTPMHEHLQKGVGEWEGTVTMLHPDMDQTPVPATETVRSAGPFWTVSEFKSAFMGQPYEGRGSCGFDPKKKKLIGTWIDNTSPWLAVMEGEYDEKTRTSAMKWEAPDMTGKVVPHRMETIEQDDAYTSTFFADGQKSMIIAMKRKGAKPAGSAR